MSEENTAQIPIQKSIRQKLWEGAIPLKIDLSLNDISSLETPESYYMMVPRMSYFSIILKDVRDYFDSFAPIGVSTESIWFEYNKFPMKWNVPVGVLFDLLVGKKKSKDHLPWSITFHYRGYPDDVLLSLKGIESIRFNYINALKEAMYLRTGSSKDILNMSKNDEGVLIQGVIEKKYEDFWKINTKLNDILLSNFKNAPVRIYVSKLETFIQQGGPLIDENGKEKTIGEYLHQFIPSLFIKEESGEIRKKDDSFEVLTQGVEVELSTSLYWMCLNFNYCDNFVYVSIRIE